MGHLYHGYVKEPEGHQDPHIPMGKFQTHQGYAKLISFHPGGALQ
jgi:hypothetical protein